MPNGISVSSVRDSIVTLLYDSLFGLMTLWFGTESPEALIKGFLRQRLKSDFDIDRVGIFRVGGENPEFVIGVGLEPYLCPSPKAFEVKEGESKLLPTNGYGYDLFIRVGEHVFCYDDTGHKRRFGASDVRILEQVSSVIQKIMRAKFEAARNVELALRDTLTGLPNRRGFDELIGKIAVGEARRFCVGAVDIDNFKQVNDGHSHDIGDRAIKMVADVIGGIVSTRGGVAARFGGDEFMVVLSESEEDGFEEIRAAIEADRTVVDDGVPVPITVTIGCANWTTGSGSTCLHAVGVADVTLLTAKRNGRNRVAI